MKIFQEKNSSSLYLKQNLNKKTIENIFDRINEVKICRQRSVVFTVPIENLFIKISPLGKLSAKLRATFNIARGAQKLDAPVESLKNSLLIGATDIPSPKLIGYGFEKQLGITQKIITIHEYLHDHSDGLEWLQRHPNQVEILINQVFKLVLEMHRKGHYHLDLWLKNIMLNNGDSLKIIDFEHYFIGRPENRSAALGLIFGYFYFTGANKFIGEEVFDKITYAIIGEEENINIEEFSLLFNMAKSKKISRHQRLKILLQG